MSYRKGRRFEYQVKRYLEELGFFVVRCAGSKPCDLIALKPGHPPLLVECKVSRGAAKPPYPHAPYIVVRKSAGDWRSALTDSLRALGYL